MSLANTYKGVDSSGQLSLSAISTANAEGVLSLKEVLVEGGGDSSPVEGSEVRFTLYPKNVLWAWGNKQPEDVVEMDCVNQEGIEWTRDGVQVVSLDGVKTFDPATFPKRGVGVWRCYLIKNGIREVSKKFYVEERYQQFGLGQPQFPEIYSSTNGTDYIQLNTSDGIASALSNNGADSSPLFTDLGSITFPVKVITPSSTEDETFVTDNPITFDFYISSGVDTVPTGSNSSYTLDSSAKGVALIDGGKFAFDMVNVPEGRSYEIYFLQELPSGGKLQVFNMFPTWYRN